MIGKIAWKKAKIRSKAKTTSNDFFLMNINQIWDLSNANYLISSSNSIDSKIRRIMVVFVFVGEILTKIIFVLVVLSISRCVFFFSRFLCVFLDKILLFEMCDLIHLTRKKGDKYLFILVICDRHETRHKKTMRQNNKKRLQHFLGASFIFKPVLLLLITLLAPLTDMHCGVNSCQASRQAARRSMTKRR